MHGCGGVGLSAVMIAAAAGARVVAVDVSPGALDLARAFGAEAAWTPTATRRRRRELTGGGAHVVPRRARQRADLRGLRHGLRRRGRHVQVGLLPEGRPGVPMDRVIALELECSAATACPPTRTRAMLDLVAAGTLRPDRLVTRTIGLAATPAALAAMGTARPPA